MSEDPQAPVRNAVDLFKVDAPRKPDAGRLAHAAGHQPAQPVVTDHILNAQPGDRRKGIHLVDDELGPAGAGEIVDHGAGDRGRERFCSEAGGGGTVPETGGICTRHSEPGCGSGRHHYLAGRDERCGDQRQRADERRCWHRIGDALESAQPVLYDDERDAVEKFCVLGCRLRGIHRLGGKNRQPRTPCESSFGLDGGGVVAPGATQPDAVVPDRHQLRTARGDLDLVPGSVEQGGYCAAHRSRAQHRNLHACKPKGVRDRAGRQRGAGRCGTVECVTGIDGSRSGILLVDKPQGITSHGVVSRTRKLAGTRKIGHAGTLDPMATGLLVLGLNSSTRLLTYLVGLDKEYIATIRLGSSTTTDDAEGEETEVAKPEAVDALIPFDLERAIGDLTGVIQQVPSSVSAIKVAGRRAYALARAGESVELAARTVTIFAFEILEINIVGEHSPAGPRDYWDVTVRVECSSGTYIRALARDLGAALEVGGHLTALRRTRIGDFLVADAVPLAELDVASSLLSPAAVATRLFASYQLSEQQAVDLSHGKRISTPELEGTQVEGDWRPVAAIAPDGRLVGLIESTGQAAKVLVNFPIDQHQQTEQTEQTEQPNPQGSSR